MLKRTESDEEKGKDDRDDDEIMMMMMMMSSIKQHSIYSLQHITDFDIYLFWEGNAGFMPVISYVYTHELMF